MRQSQTAHARSKATSVNPSSPTAQQMAANNLEQLSDFVDKWTGIIGSRLKVVSLISLARS